MISYAPDSGPPNVESLNIWLHALVAADWNHSSGPLRLNAGLKLDDLPQANFFLNSRIFLEALADGGGTDATASGNLNRNFVNGIFDCLEIDVPFRRMTREVCKVINEQDVWPLHLARIVCEMARLAARRKKRFRITKAGLEMLPDGQAGPLFRELFIAYFRQFDLRYDFHLREVSGIQHTMAVILWRLNSIGGSWMPVRGLAPLILMPQVYAELRHSMTSQYDTEEWILAGYVLNPLSKFGLIETKKKGDGFGIDAKDFIRTTPLWQKFITFSPAPVF
jgi:hypothetical protein